MEASCTRSCKRRKCSNYNLCGHCNKEVNTKIYKEHKMLYYDAATKAWTKDDAEDDLSSDLTSLDEFEVAVTSEGSVQYESDDLDDCWEDPCVCRICGF